jgi:cysteine dioxygenase
MQLGQSSIGVQGVLETLRSIPPPRFQPGEICSHLRGLRISDATLAPYLHFLPRRYTRNLIFRDDLFELIALCWEPFTQSPIHNHSGQLCWVSIQSGALRFENYKSLDGPGPGNGIRLVPNGAIPRADAGCLDLRDLEEGIHRVSNPFPDRAVSLHVYSRPYDSCLAYDPITNSAREIQLWYHSVGGKIVQRQ